MRFQLEHPEDLQASASSVLVPLRVTATDERPAFRADIASGAAGPVRVARIRSSPHMVARRPV